MDKIKTSYKSNYQKILLAFFVCGVIASLIFRIQYTTSRYDETFNIWISARTIFGDGYLIDNPYVFQTGDLWNMPFISLWLNMTGGLRGIVLWIRFCYLLLNLLVFALSVYLLKRYIKKEFLIIGGLLVPTFAFACIYSISYDSTYMMFLTVGSLFMSAAMLEDKNRIKTGMFNLAAGVSYACMCYSYPTMLAVLPVIGLGAIVWVLKERRYSLRQAIHFFLPEVIGGMLVFGIFLIYIFSVGFENTIFANGILDSLVSDGRPLDQGENGGVFHIVYTVTINAWNAMLFLLNSQRKLYFLSIFFFVQYMIGLMKKRKWIPVALCFEIVIATFAFFFRTNGYDYFDNSYIYGYYVLWGILFSFYLKDEQHKRISSLCMAIAIIPSLVSFCVVANTALYNIKAAEGLYIGGVCSIAIMGMVCFENMQESVTLIFLITAVLVNLGTFYNNSYEGDKWYACCYKINSGILQGLHVGNEDEYYEKLEQQVGQLLDDNSSTMYCSIQYIGGYLWTGKKEAKLPSEEVEKERWADSLILAKGEFDDMPVEQKMIISDNYECIYTLEECMVWRRSIIAQGEKHCYKSTVQN